ncbi:MAG: calcium/sodium antiporter [Sediminicola sp.]
MYQILLIIGGLTLLVLGGNWLLKSAVALSLKFGVPKIVVGMTVVSFATSAPELIVSLSAAMDGHADLALGNVIGSNIANLGLVLAVTLIVGGMEVNKNFYTTDWPVMMLSSLIFFGFAYFDQTLQRWEGAVMVGLLFLFLVYLLRFQKTAVLDERPEDDLPLPLYLMVLYLGLGGAALWGGSELLIKGAVNVALLYGIGERTIAVTVVSVGTSVPELAASVIAAVKKEKAISLGNLIGSNIFNLLAVLGFTALITPIQVVDNDLMHHDVFWMLGLSFLILPLVFFPKGLHLGWKDGIVLLLCYAIFLYSMGIG